jgi:hypothetical protein
LEAGVVSLRENASFARLAAAIGGVAGWRRRSIAVALGASAAVALPPFFALPLVIPAFTGLVWLIDGARLSRSAFTAGWWFGLGHFVVGLYWVAEALLIDPAKFGWMIPFAVFGLAAGLALFPALAAVLAYLCARPGAGRVLIFAASWTAAEWLRGHVLTGFPWNLIGYVCTASDALLQGKTAGPYQHFAMPGRARWKRACRWCAPPIPGFRRWSIPTAGSSPGLALAGWASSMRRCRSLGRTDPLCAFWRLDIRRDAVPDGRARRGRRSRSSAIHALARGLRRCDLLHQIRVIRRGFDHTDHPVQMTAHGLAESRAG